MRQGQQNKRMRGRNRKNPNPLTRSFESNGGDVKIRGTAAHIAEKYVQLARDAQAAGDRVAGEHYLQHAEHYSRIVAAAQAQQQQQQQAREQAEERSSDRVNGSNGNSNGPNGNGSDATQQAGQGGTPISVKADGDQPDIDAQASGAEGEDRRPRRGRGPRRRTPYRGERNGADAAEPQPVTADTPQPQTDD